MCRFRVTGMCLGSLRLLPGLRSPAPWPLAPAAAGGAVCRPSSGFQKGAQWGPAPLHHEPPPDGGDTTSHGLGAFLTYQQGLAASSAASPPVPTPISPRAAPSPGQAAQHPLAVPPSGLSSMLEPGWTSSSKSF